ncbi:MAG: hypothetical protein JSU93_05110 [Methanobacteriota archaeon]|nr:MAG: hypothetical protein JSU93_05110 [Euryarchaeota archaeon]
MSLLEQSDARAQIALMDALIFFAIAMLICSIQLGAFARGLMADEDTSQFCGRCDPDDILTAFLRSSIGVEASLWAGYDLYVPARTVVSECIAVEVTAIGNGVDSESFDALNMVLLGLLNNLSHPLMTPHLIISRHLDDGPIVLLRIEQSPPGRSDLVASTCKLPDCGHDAATVSLLLEPAPLPEGHSI